MTLNEFKDWALRAGQVGNPIRDITKEWYSESFEVIK